MNTSVENKKQPAKLEHNKTNSTTTKIKQEDDYPTNERLK